MTKTYDVEGESLVITTEIDPTIEYISIAQINEQISAAEASILSIQSQIAYWQDLKDRYEDLSE